MGEEVGSAKSSGKCRMGVAAWESPRFGGMAHIRPLRFISSRGRQNILVRQVRQTNYLLDQLLRKLEKISCPKMASESARPKRGLLSGARPQGPKKDTALPFSRANFSSASLV